MTFHGGQPLRWLPVTPESWYSLPVVIPAPWVWLRFGTRFCPRECSKVGELLLQRLQKIFMSILLTDSIFFSAFTLWWSKLPCWEVPWQGAEALSATAFKKLNSTKNRTSLEVDSFPVEPSDMTSALDDTLIAASWQTLSRGPSTGVPRFLTTETVMIMGIVLSYCFMVVCYVARDN